MSLGKHQVENAVGTPGDKQGNEKAGSYRDVHVYQVYLVFLMACARRHVPTARMEKHSKTDFQQ